MPEQAKLVLFDALQKLILRIYKASSRTTSLSLYKCGASENVTMNQIKGRYI